jgi:nitrogen fixation/metabolism regulation signal transduction histidine kinase
MPNHRLSGACRDVCRAKKYRDQVVPGYDLLKSIDLAVYGSYNNLKQAFINVLNNAIEASSKAIRRVSLALDLERISKE